MAERLASGWTWWFILTGTRADVLLGLVCIELVQALCSIPTLRARVLLRYGVQVVICIGTSVTLVRRSTSGSLIHRHSGSKPEEYLSFFHRRRMGMPPSEIEFLGVWTRSRSSMYHIENHLNPKTLPSSFYVLALVFTATVAHL